MGAIKGCSLVPLSGWEREQVLLCELSKGQGGRCALLVAVTHLTLYLIIIFFVLARITPVLRQYYNVRAVNKYVLSVYRILAEFMFRLARCQAVARTADRTASQHLWRSRDVIGHVTI